MQTIETTSVAINTTSTAVTYTHAGVSTTNKNVTKLRFGNDASRYARIVANGDSDIDFFKLPYAMTAVEIAQHFIDTNYKADNLAVVDACIRIRRACRGNRFQRQPTGQQRSYLQTIRPHSYSAKYGL